MREQSGVAIQPGPLPRGDGLADVPHDSPDVPDGAEPVPFHGYGRVHLRFNPNMVLPDGIMLPTSVRALPGSYQEGRP